MRFVNPMSGGKAARAHLAQAAKDRGIEPVVLKPDEDLGGLAEDAVAGGADALGMAGGDRSMGVVASAAHAHGLPFGVAVQPAGYRDAKAHTLSETAREVLGPSRELAAVALVDDLGIEHTDAAVVVVSNAPQ